MKKCPKCGSRRVAPILYGMPAFDEEMKEKLNNEQLYLGGCIGVPGFDPKYHCFECGEDVASPPVHFGKDGVEDYRDTVTSIRFYDGSFSGGNDEVTIKKTTSGIIAYTGPDLGKVADGAQRALTETEWDKLLDRLFCKLYVHEWKKQYINRDVLDGEQWSLEIRMTGRRVRNYSGSNAFPAYWNELKRTFRPYFQGVR